MLNYIIRRLFLLPVTLFFILLVNFTIINLAPGDPTTVTEISPEGMASRKEEKSLAFGSDVRYLQFREYYGLTLPILINLWPFTTQESVNKNLWQLAYRKEGPQDAGELPFKKYDRLRILFGDKSKYIMPQLICVIEDPSVDLKVRLMAVRFFIRGGTRQAYLGPNLTKEQKDFNRKTSKDNEYLNALFIGESQSPEAITANAIKLRKWYDENKNFYDFDPSFGGKLHNSLKHAIFAICSGFLLLTLAPCVMTTSKPLQKKWLVVLNIR